MADHSLLCGIDVVSNEKELLDPGCRYALLSNEASVSKQGRSVKNALITQGLKITRLFSPEHGIKARGEDGRRQDDETDPETGLPVTSLYGPQLKPPDQVARDFDALVLDLPNVGARFYTYLWTMALLMEWCDSKRIPLIILDRPNPLGGDLDKAEGPYLKPEYMSFIGKWNIPIRFSLTLGELARCLKVEMKLEALPLRIIPVQGWSRIQTNQSIDYPFTPPSPAIVDKTTIWTYPALCFLEATNISEGRGGPYSFQVASAPWIDGNELEKEMNNHSLPGCQFRFFKEKSTGIKYTGINCEGVRLEVNDFLTYDPVYSGLVSLAVIQRLYPDHFKWQPYPTFVNPSGAHHLELLTGTGEIIPWINHSPLDHLGQLKQLLAVPTWKERVLPYLLYD